MSRFKRSLGVAVVAVVVLCSVGTSAASAEVLFHAEATSNTVVETPFTPLTTPPYLLLGGSELRCEGWTLEGTPAATTSTTLALRLFTSNCKYGELNADVVTTGCDLDMVLLNVKDTHTETPPTYTANTALECESGKSVSVTPTVLGMSACTIHIPAQSLSQTLSIGELTAGGAIVASAEWTGLHYTVTKGSICGSEGVHEDGKYRLLHVVHSYSDAAHTIKASFSIS